MDEFLQTQGFEGRILNWIQLAEQVGIYNVSERTIQRAMGNCMSYSKCIACQRAWISPSNAKNRLNYAIEMLRKYPTKEAWRRVRFSDEVHFSLGPQGKLRIIRRPGERYCSDCIQIEDQPKEKDRYRIHAWAAVGYNYKSGIYFYTTKASNGKMTQQDYISQILEPAI